jgi:hypothetical protein
MSYVLQGKKEIRRVNMQETRKESKVHEKKDYKVQDYTDMARGLTGLVKENYLLGFQFGLSLWEENLKTINNQIDKWAAIQESYATLMRELLEKIPAGAVSSRSGNPKFASDYVEKLVALQRDYSRVVMNTSDRFVKEAHKLMKNVIDMAFSRITL